MTHQYNNVSYDEIIFVQKNNIIAIDEIYTFNGFNIQSKNGDKI